MQRREFLATGAVPIAAAVNATRRTEERPERPERPASKRTSTQNSQSVVRVGIIGAGSNVQAVQIPGFRDIDGVEILGVANRSLESSQEVADRFDIPRAYANWTQLVDDQDVDAILIGTWPYTHRTMTIAALEHGKHVLCQARMANTAAEAREMLDASRRHPELVCQLVPTSTSYEIDNVLQGLIDEGFLGELLSIEIQRLQRGFADIGGELDWRHDREFSGFNTLNLGSTYESMMRWVGRGTRVLAMSKIHVPFRETRDGSMDSTSIPNHVDILYELTNDAQVHMRMSETTGLSNGNQTWFYGTEGTIHVDDEQNVLAGRRGDSELSPVPNPPEQQAYYRVEEEFINAIRGIEDVTMLPFEAGVHYMEWTEAVHRSAQEGVAVHLPL